VSAEEVEEATEATAAAGDSASRLETRVMSAASEFRQVAGRFGDAVHGVPADRWDAPAPV